MAANSDNKNNSDHLQDFDKTHQPIDNLNTSSRNDEYEEGAVGATVATDDTSRDEKRKEVENAVSNESGTKTKKQEQSSNFGTDSDGVDDKTEEKSQPENKSANATLTNDDNASTSSADEDKNKELKTGARNIKNKTGIQTRMPDYLSAEESNFLRFCHLIQKVAPQAVRHRFDQVFPPADLEGIIQRNMAVLNDLYRKRILTHSQWKLICPSGVAPSSLTFDITMMVCLFRHLTKTSPKSGLHDTLPPSNDTSLGADLARIKFYRNSIAHYLNRKIKNTEFPIVWETASKAISRTGGPLYEQECSSLRTANLDSSYMDIYRDVLNKEMDLEHRISDLKQSHQQLQDEHDKQISDITKSHKQMQNEHKEEIQKLQTKLKDPVPEHERENISFMREKWETTRHLFIETSAATDLNKIMKTENVAIVTGSPGTGKTFTVQNVLLSMREEGYDVIPVRSSSDLVRYFSRSARQVFFLDNLSGKQNISNSDIEEWDRNRDRLIEIFTNSSTKCIFICRLQIFLDPQFQNLKLKEYNVINLTGAHRLTLQEKQAIGQKHIGKGIMEQLTDKTIVSCVCFPLLCSLFDKHDKHTMKTSAYFEKPKHFFETELTELRERPDKTKYVCIALCVMLNNKVNLDFFSSTNEEGNRMARVVFEELGVNVPPMKAIMSCFDSMVGSFFQKTSKEDISDDACDITEDLSDDACDITEDLSDDACAITEDLSNDAWCIPTIPGYKSIHDYMFDIYCVHVSKTMINMIIRYGDSELIRDRAFLQSIGKYDENAIVVPVEFEQHFFERLLGDFSSCRYHDVFYNSQMKYESYRSKFIKFLNLIDFDVNNRDKCGRTPLHQASEAGYVDVVEMLCKKGADVNLSDKFGSTSLIAASKGNHIDVVELLCNKGADVNLYNEFEVTPLIAASVGGHIDIVELLCKKGADVNLNGKFGWTALSIASGDGHIDVVELLCNKGADINLNGKFGWTPLTAASRRGHLNVVELLCNKGADMNLRGKLGYTALTFESERGWIDALELLCNRGADVNLSDEFGMTPLITASERGGIDAVELLCNKGAEVNLVGKCGLTPLTAASERVHIDIVKLLCIKGADVNMGTKAAWTPLTVASEKWSY